MIILILLSALTSSYAPAHAQELVADFSIGSNQLESSLRNLQFEELFRADMLAKIIFTKKLASYQFVMSREGLLCPQRVVGEDEEYEFFSNSLSNTGCLDLNQFRTSANIRTEFHSERNSIRPLLSGKPERDGKAFVMQAAASDVALNTDGQVRAATLSLAITGKTYIRPLSKWVNGNTHITVRVHKNPKNKIWEIARNNQGAWKNFSVVQSFISLKGSDLTREATREHPLELNSAEVVYQ